MDGAPVGAGSLDMRLRLSAADPGGARDVVFAFAVSRIGAGADCVVILNGAEVDAQLVARLAPRDDDEQHALKISPSSRDDETESAVSAVSSTSGASLNEQVVLGAELTRGRFATTFSGTWLNCRVVVKRAGASRGPLRDFGAAAAGPRGDSLHELVRSGALKPGCGQ